MSVSVRVGRWYHAVPPPGSCSLLQKKRRVPSRSASSMKPSDMRWYGRSCTVSPAGCGASGRSWLSTNFSSPAMVHCVSSRPHAASRARRWRRLARYCGSLSVSRCSITRVKAEPSPLEEPAAAREASGRHPSTQSDGARSSKTASQRSASKGGSSPGGTGGCAGAAGLRAKSRTRSTPRRELSRDGSTAEGAGRSDAT